MAAILPNGNGRDARLLEGLLSNLPLFRGVQARNVLQAAAQSRSQRLRRGTVLYRRDERLPGVVAVGYGSVKLALRRNGGDEKVLRFVGPNETFGEATVLLDRPCPVDIVALADTMVALIPPHAVLRLMAQELCFARNVACLVGESFLELVGEFQSSVQRNGVQRLAAYLDSLAEPNGGADTWIVRLPANKTTVAARLGVTKETMSRLLRELTNRGLIEVSRREIVIIDRAQLAQLLAG
ncbi:MAG TPA: Crp/Fnr family transcriptional regulator [Burkholderiales bacterium]|nr:Crp/Fnr family transcriptional regulator [Burkholderiales bacterium]